MDDEDAEMWWWQQDLEMRELVECEHDIHKDSGHWCPERVVNRSNEDAE